MLINSLLVKLGFETDASPLEKVNEKLEGIGHKLSFLAAAEVVKGLYELAERFSGVGEAIETAAVSAGVTAEAFQKLSFAASQSAVGQDELGSAMAKLARNLFNAKNGSEQAVKAFADVGITQEQLMGFNNSSDALRVLSDRFKNIKDPIQRQAAAMELLGRGSYKMVKFLGKGSASMDELANSAESMGAVISDGDVEALAELEDTISALGQVFRSLGATIGADFAPSLMFLIQTFEKFYAANQLVIKQKFDEWIYDITYGLGYFAGVVEDVTSVFFSFINAHPKLVGWVGKAAIALGALSISTEIALGTIAFLTKGFLNLLGVIKLMPEAFGIMKTIGGGSLSVIASGLGLFQSLLRTIIIQLAVALSSVFPAFSAFLLYVDSLLVATGIPLFAAGLAAAVLAGQALWTLLHGGSFKDTWLGMMIDKIMALPSAIMRVYRYLRGGKDEAAVKSDEVLASMPTEAEPNASFMPGDGLSSQMSDAFNSANVGFSAAANMSSATPAANMSLASMMPDGQTAKGGYTLNAPVTINTSDALNSQQAYKAVKEAAGEHFDRQVRDLMRSQQTAVVH